MSDIPHITFMHIYGMHECDMVLGRPYGRCVILWGKDIKYKVSTIFLDSRRVCAILLELNGKRCFIINVYMPCDSTRVCEGSTLLDDILNKIVYK